MKKINFAAMSGSVIAVIALSLTSVANVAAGSDEGQEI